MGAGSPIVLYGAGSQVHVLNDILEVDGYKLEAIFNDVPPPKAFLVDVPILVGEEAISTWLDQTPLSLSYAISIGNEFGRARYERHLWLRSRGLDPARLIHRTSYVSESATVGGACQLLAFSFVGARATLGEAVILNTKASVDHECHLGDGVHIGPGATLAGRVQVGAYAFIGAGATVLPEVSIAAEVVVGAGAVVTHSLSEIGTYAGVPARLLRSAS